jgi:hypothetical protein
MEEGRSKEWQKEYEENKEVEEKDEQKWRKGDKE